VRVPFLDHRLVEFAFSLPDNLCIRKGKKKYVLRQFLKDRIPSRILRKKKQGFSCPVTSYWPVDKMVQGIDQGTLIQNGILSRTAWEHLKEQPKIPYREAKIWMIAVLEKWSVNWLN
ncbi:MAG: asparagine synthase, partial [Deltaproteobacteria bacterium]|nr:asparagine synthase [Deltaproteobacteria bacterium]